MRKPATLVLGLGLGIGSTLLAYAADPMFDVKTGLWEITSTVVTSGQPPIPEEALVRMSPEQRAKVEAAMRSAMARNNQPQRRKSCLTQRQLEKEPVFSDEHAKGCHRTVLRRTASLIDTRIECTGPQKLSGTFHLEALSRDNIRGEFDMAVSRGDRQMSSKTAIEGRWLGADCGDVKPSGE